MHPAIAAFPSTIFYEGKLNSAKLTEERALIKSSLFTQPVVFIDMSSKETQFGKSYRNEAESDVVRKLIAQLIEDNINPASVSVLTPHLAQAVNIRDNLTVKGTEVCTTDAFQGREKDIIIFSTVRCNSSGLLDNVDDKYWMNVLLIKAKKGILGVGCVKTLQSSSLREKWLQQSKILTVNDLSNLLPEKSSKSTNYGQGQRVNSSAFQKGTSHRSGQPYKRRKNRLATVAIQSGKIVDR